MLAYGTSLWLVLVAGLPPSPVNSHYLLFCPGLSTVFCYVLSTVFCCGLSTVLCYGLSTVFSLSSSEVSGRTLNSSPPICTLPSTEHQSAPLEALLTTPRLRHQWCCRPSPPERHFCRAQTNNGASRGAGTNAARSSVRLRRRRWRTFAVACNTGRHAAGCFLRE